MKIIIESTTKIVELKNEHGIVSARVWEGETDTGIKVHAFITRISHDLDEPADRIEQFTRELLAQRPPSAEVARAYDLRMIL